MQFMHVYLPKQLEVRKKYCAFSVDKNYWWRSVYTAIQYGPTNQDVIKAPEYLAND